MTLYEECLEELKGNYTIVSDNEKNKILNNLYDKFPFNDWGRINWDKVIKKERINNIVDIKEKILNNSIEVYVIWDQVDLPIIKSDLCSVLNVIYDVTAVSFDTWLFSVDEEYVIEFYHDGEIMIGF